MIGMQPEQFLISAMRLDVVDECCRLDVVFALALFAKDMIASADFASDLRKKPEPILAPACVVSA